MCSSNSSKRTQAPHTVSKLAEAMLALEPGAANIDAGINRARDNTAEQKRRETQRVSLDSVTERLYKLN